MKGSFSLLAVSLFASSSVLANTLISSPAPALNITSPSGGTSFSGVIGDNSVVPPAWNFAQWGNPQPITGSIVFKSGGNWSVSGGSNPSTNAYTIAHSNVYDNFFLTQNVQTRNTSQPNYVSCQSEEDLFIGPNGVINLYNSSMPAPRIFDFSAPLGSLSNLNVNFNMAVESEVVSTTTCNISYMSYGVTLLLNNQVNGQAMFYTINVRNTTGATGNYGECVGYPQGNPSVYCFGSDVTGIFNKPMQKVTTTPTFYSLNFLPGILSLFKNNVSGLDSNPNDWVVTGFYFGQGGNGDVNATSDWNEISITAY